jgi:hypothetical protein
MLYFVVAMPISISQTPSWDKRVHVRRDVILWLIVFPPLAYVSILRGEHVQRASEIIMVQIL